MFAAVRMALAPARIIPQGTLALVTIAQPSRRLPGNRGRRSRLPGRFWRTRLSSLGNSDEAHDEEPSPYEHLGEDRPRLCQQQVPLEVNGNVGFVHVLYDWETPNTLMRIEAARRMNLQSIRIPRRAIKGYQGVGTITDSAYCVPLLDADGNVRVIRAYGVEEIAIVVRTRLPPQAP